MLSAVFVWNIATFAARQPERSNRAHKLLDDTVNGFFRAFGESGRSSSGTKPASEQE